jgi:hypothetical protein
MPPAPTDLLNQDINRLTGVIDKLASKVEDETKWSRQFQLDLTKTLGEINTKIGGMQTTIRIAGAIATLATGFVLYVGRNMYQTVFTEGEKVGALQVKIDMMETKFNEHIRNQTQPTSYKVSPPGQPAIPAPDTPHPPGPVLGSRRAVNIAVVCRATPYGRSFRITCRSTSSGNQR